MCLRKYRCYRNLVKSQRYTIIDLKRKVGMNDAPNHFRNRVKIAIIDDEGVSEGLLKSLRNHNFIVQDYEDIENVDQLAAYDVVICDVNGIAKKINPEKQGLALINELHKNYPQKALAVYSGKTHKLPELPEGVSVIDKDADIDTWVRKIDNLIARVANPFILWTLTAHKLVDVGVPSSLIASVEDDYVGRIINKQSFVGFPADEDALGPEALSIITRIISKSIISIITA